MDLIGRHRNHHSRIDAYVDSERHELGDEA